MMYTLSTCTNVDNIRFGKRVSMLISAIIGEGNCVINNTGNTVDE